MFGLWHEASKLSIELVYDGSILTIKPGKLCRGGNLRNVFFWTKEAECLLDGVRLKFNFEL